MRAAHPRKDSFKAGVQKPSVGLRICSIWKSKKFRDPCFRGSLEEGVCYVEAIVRSPDFWKLPYGGPCRVSTLPPSRMPGSLRYIWAQHAERNGIG